MVWGLFIVAAVSGLACLLAAGIKTLKIRFEYEKERAALRVNAGFALMTRSIDGDEV
jgi:hypothetical protein